MVAFVKFREYGAACFNQKRRNKLPGVKKNADWIHLNGVIQKHIDRTESEGRAMHLILLANVFSEVSCLTTGLTHPNVG